MTALRVRLIRQMAQLEVGVLSHRPVTVGPALVCKAHGLVSDGCHIKQVWKG